MTVSYLTKAPTETDITIPTGYTAYRHGSETIDQGETDNSEYGAEVTVEQEYYVLPTEETE